MKIRFRGNSFAKAVMMLMSGSIIAQAITLLLSPLLSRIFTPGELGVYTVLQSCVGMFGSILSLRYDMVIVSEQDKENMYALVVLSAVLCLISSLLVTAGFGVYLAVKNIEGVSLGIGVSFILVSSILTGTINILTAYNNKLREYKIISTTNIARKIVQNALMVLSGWLKCGANGLLMSSVLALICGVNKQWKSLKKESNHLKRVNCRDLNRVAGKYKNQALLFTPAAFLNSFFYSGLNLLIEGMYGTHTLGLYSYSYRILVLPITLISVNVSGVFMEQAAREWNEHQNFKKTYLQTIAVVAAMAIPIWIVLKLISPWMFEFVFGAQWREAGVYVQLLITMFTLGLVSGCISGAAVIVGKQIYDLMIQSILAACLVVNGILAYAAHWDIHFFFRSINFSASIIYGVYIILFYICACGRKKKE